MAIDLIKRNKTHNFVILEQSSSVGGTWSDNKYPGCCCDGKYRKIHAVAATDFV
jgi:cation diffusion facilitator CzcD-associated flavoprotein CzcO